MLKEQEERDQTTTYKKDALKNDRQTSKNKSETHASGHDVWPVSS
jgi:hypothetical protein